MLMNWPSFNAAPRIRPSVATNRRTFASDMKTLPVPPRPVDRRMDSEAAPKDNDAASAGRELDVESPNEYTHSRSETICLSAMTALSKLGA
jgi:hypothetical protein